MASKKQLDTDSILGGLDSEEISPDGFTHPAEASGYPKSAPLDLPAERIMSGKRKSEPVKKRTMVLELDPRTCRRWRYYDRFEEWFTYEHCKDLIDDMHEREQEIPGIVRKLDSDPDGYEYEVVFGGRRHFSANYITEEKGTFKPFKAILKELTDQEAARLMDLENRKRADISDFERCVSYRQQIGKTPGYEPIFKTLNELRFAIESGKEDGESSNHNGKSLTKAALSQMIAAGELNEIEELISLFKGRRIKIPWSHAYHLMQKWNSDEDNVQARILAKAKELEASASGKTPEQILKDLLEASQEASNEPRTYYKEDLKLDGKVAIKASASAKDLSLKIPLKIIAKSDQEALLDLIKSAMLNASKA